MVFYGGTISTPMIQYVGRYPPRDNIRTLSKNNPLPLNQAPWRQRCRCPRAISTQYSDGDSMPRGDTVAPVLVRGSRYGSGKPSAMQILRAQRSGYTSRASMTNHMVSVCLSGTIRASATLLRCTQWWTNTLAGFVL